MAEDRTTRFHNVWGRVKYVSRNIHEGRMFTPDKALCYALCEEMDRMQVEVIDKLEKEILRWKDAYTNMRDWAEANGLDTKAYHGGSEAKEVKDDS